MANIIASTTQAAGATTTSASTSWSNNDVLICSCVIGAVPPNQQCQVTLLGSIDNTTFVPLRTYTFGVEPKQTYYRSFRLSDFVGAADGLGAGWLEQLNSASAAVPSNLKLQFAGNDTQPVTIAAVH
jgi:hypothetical protein